MKKNTPLLAIILLIAFFFASITPISTVLAAEPQQEQLFHRLIVSGYYAMYLDGSGKDNWVAEEFPGQINKVSPGDTRNMMIGQIPCQVKAKGKITRVEVKTIDTITPDILNSMEANKTTFWRPLSYDGFQKMYLKPKSGQINPTVKMINDQGDVEVTANVLLSPLEKAALVAENPNLAQYYANATWSPNSSAVLWTVPVVVEWYGVPLAPVGPPDFATDIYTTKINAKPGEKVTEKISFTLNPEYTKPLKAIVTVFHEVGENRYLVNLEAIDPKNTLPENQVIEFQPGEKKEYWATITVQNSPSYLASYILPIKNPEEVKPSDLYDVPGIIEQKIKEQKVAVANAL